MSLITITVNTETKDLKVNIDGTDVGGNVKEARCYKYKNYDGEQPYVDFYACIEDEKIGKVSKITTLSAYANTKNDTLGKDNDVFVSQESVSDWVRFLN